MCVVMTIAVLIVATIGFLGIIAGLVDIARAIMRRR